MDTVTLLVSIAAFLISAFSLGVAVHANRAALFKRRFEVYKDVEEFLAAWQHHARPDMSLFRKLTSALNRSHFLFGPEITQYLLKVWDDAAQANLDWQVISGEAPGDRDEALARAHDLEQNPSILNHKGYPKSANSDSPSLLEVGGQQVWPNLCLKIFERD